MRSTDEPSGMRTSTAAPGGPDGVAEEHAIGGEQRHRDDDQEQRAPRSGAGGPCAASLRRAPVEEGLQQHRRRLRVVPASSGVRDVVGIRRAIDVVRRSSSVRIGMLHRLRSRATNASVSIACGPRSPRSVSGRPTTTTSGASRSMIAHSSAMPLLPPTFCTTQSGRASVPLGSLTATPVRALP